MKRILSLAILAALTFSLSSCLEERCEEERTVIGFDPITVSAAEWRNSNFFCGTALPVCTTSSFYVYDNYLFMVEENEGLHIYDNTDSNNPVPITFMEAPGGQGIAVRNGILYMNQYTDLVAFSLANPEQPEMVGRTEDVFEPYSIFAQVLENDVFVTGFNETSERRTIDCQSPNFNNQVFWEGDIFFAENSSVLRASSNFDAALSSPNANAGGAGPDNIGQGGSLARFTISSSTLYAVDDNSLRVFDLADAENPVFSNNIDLGWGIETIFPYEDKLFIGANNGMHIYSVAMPTAPEKLSTFEHVLSCDPVVVANDLAYVTLWGGRDCGSVGDQLEVIDVSDARNPVSLQITPMTNSHGLGVAEGKLFLCAQWEGLKVFDLTDDGLLGEQLSSLNNINARDVIVLPGNNNLIVLGYGEDGVQQFDYTDEGQLTATSRIDLCD
ncbi:LVIVD repeat-containing protein [Neolewinella persica]|uniref:LVIVD repeat-containing protein n=1 Tax=Neolewinella persica TaxID=70998 RepID=UPI000379C909|nr:hypothetical protein [Neolewinella persica]